MSDPNIPFVVSWNITNMCNLRCSHCYLDADYLDGRVRDELTTEEGFRLIDEIASLNPNAVLILTGGEPLMREDLYELSEYSAKKGLMPVLGTNGTLLTDEIMKKLKAHGMQGIGLSIDSLDHKLHDEFRGVTGSLKKTLNAIDIIRDNGMEFQVQTTVTEKNYHEALDIIDFADKVGCKVFNLFFLVCTGRGQKMTDITPQQYEDLLAEVVNIQDKYTGRMIIKPKCAPHFKRLAHKLNKESILLRGYKSDCLAGVNYCRVTPEGDMTACPYMPLSVGNVKGSFVTNWNESELFKELRKREYKNKCGICEYRVICGGCRARTYATGGDYMSDDPWCTYEPTGDIEPVVINKEKNKQYWVDVKTSMPWEPDALARMDKVPHFVRNMVIQEVEKLANQENAQKVTLDIVSRVRSTMRGPMNMMKGMDMSNVDTSKTDMTGMKD